MQCSACRATELIRLAAIQPEGPRLIAIHLALELALGYFYHPGI